MTDLEKRFDRDMRNIYITAKRECGYNATRFLQLISTKGGLAAAKQLICKVSDGFGTLIMCGRPDLTVEAHVLKPEYATLFSDEERALCRERLAQFGYRGEIRAGCPRSGAFMRTTDEITALVDSFFAGTPIFFRDLVPSMLQDGLPVVYAIFDSTTHETLYVGRTKNLRQRLYYNHLMGPVSNARLKKYLIEDPNEQTIRSLSDAKEYLRSRCYFRYVSIQDMRTRGQVEGLLSYCLNVRYIHEEH